MKDNVMAVFAVEYELRLYIMKWNLHLITTVHSTVPCKIVRLIDGQPRELQPLDGAHEASPIARLRTTRPKSWRLPRCPSPKFSAFKSLAMNIRANTHAVFALLPT